MARNDKKEPKGKGKKAHNRLKAVNDEIDAIRRLFKAVKDSFITIFEGKSGFKQIDGLQLIKTEPKKIRSMIKHIPDRIEFGFRNLDFYIDFTVVTSTSEDTADIKGCMIYGVSRTLCFTKCIFPKRSRCKTCERIIRCDGLEDKPLLQFTVNRNGIVKSGSELDDEWLVTDKEDLLDLHLRALDLIWGRALEWTNENLLP